MAVLFWAGVSLVFVAYVGYPMWVLVRARIRPRAFQSGPVPDDLLPDVTCVIAAANEGKAIDRKLRALADQDYPANRLRVLVVSDASTDDTDTIVQEWAARDGRFSLLRNPDRRGKPAALELARPAIRTEVAIFMDVRQGLTAGALRELVGPLTDPTVGLVSGDLRVRGDGYWTYEALIRKAESRSGSMVQVTGSLYSIRAADVPAIPPDIILDDVFVPLKVVMSGRRIVMAERAGSLDVVTQSASSEFVRKVRTNAGLVQICHRVKGTLVPWRNPVWGRFIMHKLVRLACPYAMIATFAAAWFVPGWFYRAAAWAMVGALLLGALVDIGGRTRLGSLVRSFLVLNLAALVAVPAWYFGWASVKWARVETDRS